jgi:dihydropyrimidinase
MNTMMELVVKGGTVVTASSRMRADVGVADGRITAIGLDLPSEGTVIDASGAYVFPGGVDCHVHMNTASQMSRPRADSIERGTVGALAGGVTFFADFAGQEQGGSLRAALARSVAIAERESRIDYSFHLIIADPTPEVAGEVAGLVDEGYPSYKFFTPQPAFNSRGGDYLRFLNAVASAGGLAMFHCEDAAILDYTQQQVLAAGKTAVSNYPDSRPPEVEAGATARAMEIAAATGVPMYVVHLSCEAALLHTRAARARGLPVYVETRPIYLYLNCSRFDADDAEAAKYVGIPPLRPQSDIDVLWAALRSGDIHTVQTDHVGYAMAEKYHEGDTCLTVPPGMSNLETLLPMLYSEGVGKGRITLERFVEAISTNPAKLFGLYPRKGTIAVGSDADLCILDPAKSKTIHAPDMHGGSDFEVYEGFDVTGWPVVTISRGEVVFKNDEVCANPGRGMRVPRSRFTGL